MNTEHSSSTDLRTMLQRRVDEVRAERQRVAARLKDLEVQEAAYLRALEAENRRLHGAGSTAAPNAARFRKRLAEDLFTSTIKGFLLETLKDGRAWSLEALKGLAEQKKVYIPEDASRGRVLHGALLGLRQAGLVESLGSGNWRIVQREAPSAGN